MNTDKVTYPLLTMIDALSRISEYDKDSCEDPKALYDMVDEMVIIAKETLEDISNN